MTIINGETYDTDIYLTEQQFEVVRSRGVLFDGSFEVSCSFITDEELEILQTGGSVDVDVFVESVGTGPGTLRFR